MPDENNQVDPDNINYTTNTYGSNSEETGSENNTNDDLEEINEPPVELKEEFVKPKKSILPKILIGIVGVLILLLIIGALLYFTGFFAPKEPPVKVEQKEVTPVVVEKVETTDNGYKFDVKDINSKKLNEQLANLTNKNVHTEKTEEKENEKKLIEEQKQKEDELLKNQENELLKQKAQLEEKKLELEKEKAQLEEMKQQAAVLKNELETNSSNNVVEGIPSKATEKTKIVADTKEVINTKQQDKDVNKNNQFLLFISVAKIKGVLYKKYLDKIVAINPNVKLCRDDKNRIEIYYGPFEKNEDRTELLNKLINNKFNEAYELEFTQEEYDKRCNY